MKKNDNKMQRRSFGTAMGITSIIAILVVLILVVFASLSLITAKADFNLSKKTADNVSSYYTADNTAEQIIAEFGEDFAGSSGVFTEGKDYSYDNTTRLFSFSVIIDDSRELKVEVVYNSNGEVKETKLWQVVPTKEWKSDNQIKLFEP